MSTDQALDSRQGWMMMPATAARIAVLVGRSAPVHAGGCVAAALISAVVPVVAAWLTKLTLEELVWRGPLNVVVVLAAGLAAAGMIGAVIPQVSQYLRAEIDRRAGLRAKDQLFAAVERFVGLARFEDPVFLDRLRLAQQSAAQPGQLVDQMLQIGRGLLLLAGFVVSLAVISLWLIGAILAAAVLAVLIEFRLSRQRATMLWRIGPVERREFVYSHLLSTVNAAKEIRLFGIGGFLRSRMNSELRTASSARRRVDRWQLVLQGMLALLSAVISGGGLLWLITSASRGRLTVGDVSMFIAAVAGIQGAVNSVVGAMAGAHQQLYLFSHYIAVTQAAPDLAVQHKPRNLPTLRYGIELRDVWFRYSDEHPWVLCGLNLFLPHGYSVALVGLNGSGKSTLVKLLCRLYDPTRGEVLWDGVNIKDVSVRELRGRIGAVFQDFMNYDFSAADNIAVGDLAALGDQHRIEKAARQAGVHDTIVKLPYAYDTLLTRMFFSSADRRNQHTGVVLSGGQWQRLALARGLLRQDRELMILDEPSSGLDAEAEHAVHAQLRRARAGRTTLLISHRLSANRDADVIVVLTNGYITERGSHTELIAKGGTYARLFKLQAAGYGSDPKKPPVHEDQINPVADFTMEP